MTSLQRKDLAWTGCPSVSDTVQQVEMLSHSSTSGVLCWLRGLGGSSSLELPVAPAEGAALLCLRRQPLGDALQVEGVAADAPDHWAVLPRVFAIGRAAIEGHAADATHVIARVPCPGGNSTPVVDLHVPRHGPACA